MPSKNHQDRNTSQQLVHAEQDYLRVSKEEWGVGNAAPGSLRQGQWRNHPFV